MADETKVEEGAAQPHENLEPGLTSGDVLLAARHATRGTFVFGAVLVTLGVFAVVAPLFAGIATTVLIGFLLFTSGIVETLFAFRAPSFGKGALVFLFGGLSVAAGVVMLFWPGEGLGALTLILAVFFVAGGIVDLILAFKLKPAAGWGWTLFGGIVSILLGVLLIASWPFSGIWAVGVYVGVRMVIHGWILMAAGTTGADTVAYVQNARLESLENHVRAGLAGLQETQLALAALATTQLALALELESKVSSSKVDPAIQELNEELQRARADAETVAAATAEVWDAAQQEANRSFDSLQQVAGDLIGKVQKQLGLEGG